MTAAIDSSLDVGCMTMNLPAANDLKNDYLQRPQSCSPSRQEGLRRSDNALVYPNARVGDPTISSLLNFMLAERVLAASEDDDMSCASSLVHSMVSKETTSVEAYMHEYEINNAVKKCQERQAQRRQEQKKQRRQKKQQEQQRAPVAATISPKSSKTILDVPTAASPAGAGSKQIIKVKLVPTGSSSNTRESLMKQLKKHTSHSRSTRKLLGTGDEEKPPTVVRIAHKNIKGGVPPLTPSTSPAVKRALSAKKIKSRSPSSPTHTVATAEDVTESQHEVTPVSRRKMIIAPSCLPGSPPLVVSTSGSSSSDLDECSVSLHLDDLAGGDSCAASYYSHNSSLGGSLNENAPISQEECREKPVPSSSRSCIAAAAPPPPPSRDSRRPRLSKSLPSLGFDHTSAVVVAEEFAGGDSAPKLPRRPSGDTKVNADAQDRNNKFKSNLRMHKSVGDLSSQIFGDAFDLTNVEPPRQAQRSRSPERKRVNVRLSNKSLDDKKKMTKATTLAAAEAPESPSLVRSKSAERRKKQFLKKLCLSEQEKQKIEEKLSSGGGNGVTPMKIPARRLGTAASHQTIRQ